MTHWSLSPMAPEEFEARCLALGLEVERSSLRTRPASVHWHLRRPGHKGVLEATWDPAEERLWLSVHNNRRAEWQAEFVQALTLNT
jgi:hypothetical protein